MSTTAIEMRGGCTCGAVRYRLAEPPMFVNCCHCSWCQRETGSAFAINAIIETDQLEVTGAVEFVALPSASGKGQEVGRCPACKVAVYSHYAGARRSVAFVRVGTLENPGALSPDIHIFTATKLPWLVLDGRVPVVAEYYDRKQHWPQDSLARFAALRARQQNT